MPGPQYLHKTCQQRETLDALIYAPLTLDLIKHSGPTLLGDISLQITTDRENFTLDLKLGLCAFSLFLQTPGPGSPYEIQNVL